MTENDKIEEEGIHEGGKMEKKKKQIDQEQQVKVSLPK